MNLFRAAFDSAFRLVTELIVLYSCITSFLLRCYIVRQKRETTTKLYKAIFMSIDGRVDLGVAKVNS